MVSGGSRRSEASAPDERTIVPAGNVAAVALVTKMLQDICPGVTRYLLTCYAELLEYLHRSNNAADEG